MDIDWKFILVTAIAVVGIITTILLGIKQIKKKRPVWSYITKKIVELDSKSPTGLQLTYAGNPINNAYATRIVFLNRGTEVIQVVMPLIQLESI